MVLIFFIKKLRKFNYDIGLKEIEKKKSSFFLRIYGNKRNENIINKSMDNYFRFGIVGYLFVFY